LKLKKRKETKGMRAATKGAKVKGNKGNESSNIFVTSLSFPIRKKEREEERKKVEKEKEKEKEKKKISKLLLLHFSSFIQKIPHPRCL